MKRNHNIDIAKGLGILLVVFGHNWIVWVHHDTLLFQMIYAFHMPLFYVLGGVFLNPSQPIEKFTGSKADALLKPYVSVLLLVGAWRIGIGATAPVAYLSGILYGVGSTIEWVQLWFLPSLFITLLCARLLLRWLQDQPYASAMLAALIVVLFALGAEIIPLYRAIPASHSPVLTWMFGSDAVLRGLPFSLDLLPLTAAFLLLGYLLREPLKQATFHPIGLSVASVLFVALNLWFPDTTDLNMREYGHWLATPLRALAGIYIVMSLAALAARSRLPAEVLAYLGRTSLIILLFHGWVEWTIYGKLLKHFPDHPYPNAVLAFFGSLAISLVLYEASKRIAPMAWLLLARRRQDSIRMSH
jgi:fucose 4-O-acetylase-like acetyltransferase